MGELQRDGRRIWLNLELVKKPISCLEYVPVHEMVHLASAGTPFGSSELMEALMPRWKPIGTS